MKFTKLAIAGVMSAFLFTSVQAAPSFVPSKVSTDSAIELAAAKKKVAKKKAAPKKVVKKAAPKKKVAKVGPGKCGATKYWDKKKKACASKA